GEGVWAETGRPRAPATRAAAARPPPTRFRKVRRLTAEWCGGRPWLELGICRSPSGSDTLPVDTLTKERVRRRCHRGEGKSRKAASTRGLTPPGADAA